MATRRRAYKKRKTRRHRRRRSQRGGNTVYQPPESIRQLIHHVFYINLNDRTDRKEQVEKEFAIFPAEQRTRIAAIKNATLPVLGSAESHLNAIKAAKASGKPNALIAEDDFIWTADAVEGGAGWSAFDKIIKKGDYDVIMLGATHTTPNRDTYRVTKASSVHAYLVNSKYYDTLINKLESTLQQFKSITGTPSDSDKEKLYVDIQYQELQPRNIWYLVDPPIAIQRPSKSDITGNVEDYTQYFGKDTSQ